MTPWTVARQAPLSMGFPGQEYWTGLPCSPPGDLPNPGIEPGPLMSPALAGRFFTTSATWEALVLFIPFRKCVSFLEAPVLYKTRVLVRANQIKTVTEHV